MIRCSFLLHIITLCFILQAKCQEAKPYSVTFHWHAPHDGGSEIRFEKIRFSSRAKVLHFDLGDEHEVSRLQGG